MDIRNKIDTILLCDIANHLGVETEIDTDLVKYAITTGNSWILDAKYSIFNVEEASKKDRDFVVDILNMYRGLSAAIRKLPQDTQKNFVEKFELRIIDKNIQIPGFDGNNEAQYFSILETFLKFDRYVEQKEPIENTHSETVDGYSKMLVEYKKFGAPNRNFKLNEEEIAAILSLAPHGI